MKHSLHRWRAGAVVGLLLGMAVAVPVTRATDDGGATGAPVEAATDSGSTSSSDQAAAVDQTAAVDETAAADRTATADHTAAATDAAQADSASAVETQTLAVASRSANLLPTGGQNGTTLVEASVTVAAHSELVYGWTINKSVTPSTIDMFAGDTADATYTVSVTKDGGTLHQWIDGQVCVTNGGVLPTEGLAITILAGPGKNSGSYGSGSVNLSGNPVLDPDEHDCYHYAIDLSSPLAAGSKVMVTADITILNHSGSIGTPTGPNPSSSATMPTTTVVNDSITVDDTNGMSWTFDASGTKTYTTTFGTAGTYHNTVTIKETGQSASADVTVNVYTLSVGKTATTSWDRDWTWGIAKSVTPTSMTLSAGQVGTASWTVTLTPTSTDSGYAVSGTITVTNPAPIAATLTGVSDMFGSMSIAVSCPSMTVPAKGSLECTYTKSLSGPTGGTNTATATQQNYHYASDGTATAKGTTDYHGTAAVAFSTTPTTETDECVTVSDNMAATASPAFSFPSQVCVTDATKSFTYSTPIGPYATSGLYVVTNTATFTTNDNGETGSDDAAVTVTVPAGGCTLTQGYWKTHSAVGPAPYDDLWAAYQSKVFFLSGKTWYQVYWTTPAGGSVYYNLAHQYEAATMNIANGAASTAAVDAALAGATNFFNTYTPTSTLSTKVKNQALQWATLLDSYNNGVVGPGHCSE